MSDSARSLFAQTFSASPTLLARAPGRIEVIGNHTDYNGGTVLGAAIDRTVEVAFRPRTDGRILLVSDLLPGVVASTAKWCGRRGMRPGPITLWGCWWRWRNGVSNGITVLNLRSASDVPSGSGLSSSAALELSSALVLVRGIRVGIESQ